MAVNVQKPHEMSALIDTQTRKPRAQLLGAMVRREAGEPAPQRLYFRRSVEPEESAEGGRVSFLEMLGPLDAEQRHEQERQQRRAQAIERRTDFTVELAADPKQPALDQTREREQDANTGNRGPLAKERCGIIEQPQMGELPIERSIARVAVEAHRHRLTVFRRRGDRIAVACAVLRRWHGAIHIIAGRRCRRYATRRWLPHRRGGDLGERKLRAVDGLRSSNQLANSFLADAQPMRDRPIAHPLALQHLDAAQTFPRNPPSTATPTLLATECYHPALRITPLVP